MNRYRLRHKATGEVVELSAMSEYGALSQVGWRMTDTYLLYLGSLSIMATPKWYVRPMAAISNAPNGENGAKT